MSGTSLDGIDAALLEVEEVADGSHPHPPGFPCIRWELLSFRTRPYGPEERRALQDALALGSAPELTRLHAELGELFAQAALELLEEGGIDPEGVDAVGSHGQTVWHDPPRDGARGGSLQLGCTATIAERTGIPVIGDFRSRDLAAGGHGAPLVPWADRVLFSSPDGPRALQNLGGMANVTWLPALSDPASPLAFDTGPGVVLLDLAAAMASAGAVSFDRDGEMARGGRVSEKLLEDLLSDPFFRSPPPRSTGRERFGAKMMEWAAAQLGRELGAELVPGSTPQAWRDLLATLAAFTARSVGESYREWVLARGVDAVFLTGGGARNPVLVKLIQEELAPVPVRGGWELGMDPDAREAAAFALLAWAHLERIPANVPEATGADGARVLGSWTPGGPGRNR
jgi:anhydro-N-acetylmuramic acid kinase